jgi:hypothetical protein
MSITGRPLQGMLGDADILFGCALPGLELGIGADGLGVVSFGVLIFLSARRDARGSSAERLAG